MDQVYGEGKCDMSMGKTEIYINQAEWARKKELMLCKMSGRLIWLLKDMREMDRDAEKDQVSVIHWAEEPPV